MDTNNKQVMTGTEDDWCLDNRSFRVLEDRIANEAIAVRTGDVQSTEKMESMLSDDEALEGVEAWLNRQELRINMASRDSKLEADRFVESSAGWLLRLIRHARTALSVHKPGNER